MPAAFLAHLTATAGRAGRRALLVARQSAVNTSPIELGNPLLRLAPVVVSGVLVAMPVTAVVLADQRGSSARVGQTTTTDRRALARSSAGHRSATAPAARASSASLAQSGSSRQTRATLHSDVLVSQGRSEQVGAREAAQTVPGGELPAGIAPPAAAANAPAAAHSLLRDVLKRAGAVAAQGLDRVTKQVAPPAAVAEHARTGATALAAGVAQQERTATPAASASQRLDPTAVLRTAITPP